MAIVEFRVPLLECTLFWLPVHREKYEFSYNRSACRIWVRTGRFAPVHVRARCSL